MMREKFFTSEHLNDMIVDIAEFISSKKISNFHVYTFKRFSARDICPHYAALVFYEYKKKGV
ncbi:hypothetical protein KAR91_12285 [Candidatus Pacearchaeota archaeon]|nr:hypothetical protein [Candidatus Pacearchaeota archaeon]